MTDTDASRATPLGPHGRGSGYDDDRLGAVLRALSGNLDADDLGAGGPPEDHTMSPLWIRLAAARAVLVL